jgi:putative peptide zinc metalloprotease protein
VPPHPVAAVRHGAGSRERLTSIAYQATVLLEEDAHLIKTGMRGKVRFLVARRSAGDWIWRYLRRTFHFRL